MGTLLGSRGINLAGYQQSRLSRGGKALAAVVVDEVVDPGVRDALLELPEVSIAVVAGLE